jgi:uncharacterized protein
MRGLTIIVCLFAVISARASAQSDDLAGDWKGTWVKDGDSVSITTRFTKSGDVYSGAFDSDALQVVGIPFSDITDENGKIHFQVKGDQSATLFDGVATDKTISGTFIEGNSKGAFELTRTTLASAHVDARDVTFKSKDVTLAGTVLLPASSGKHPAIVFLQGSGPEGRWANHYLAQKFAERGFIALIYDKRGVGKSSGNWQKAGFEALADDAVAGVRFLQSRPDVDSRRVGVYGHSQGGTIAPLVAVRAEHLGFIIASSAGGIDPAAMEIYSVENSIGVSGLLADERADAQTYVRALVDSAYRGTDHGPLEALAAKFKTREWYFDLPPSDSSYWTISKQIASFKPAQYWRLINEPVLLVFGAHDERVPTQESASAMQTALGSAGNKSVTLKIFPRSDHTFTIVDPAQKGGWPKHEPDYADTLVKWALLQTSELPKSHAQ